MSLQFVFGGSGSGKTTLLLQTIIEESIREPDKQFLVIVPEQFTMQTQRELVMRHPRHGILNIDVLSFQRLAYRVMEQTGMAGRTVLTETGKNLILRKVSAGVRDSLQLLGGRLDRQGTVSLVKSMLSELSQYGVGEDELQDMIALSESRSRLKRKLEDLLVLMRAFQAYRQDQFMTGEEVLQVLADMLPEAEIYRGCSVVLDSFTGFTPLQMKVLRTMFTTADSVRIALTLDAGESPGGRILEQDLFYLTKKTVQSLSRLAADAGTQILEPVWAGKGTGRFRPGSALKQLSQSLLHFQAACGDTSSWDGDISDIRLFECPSPGEEAQFAAENIRRLVFEKGYRFREIAVIAGSMLPYECHLANAMEAYRIPYFIDHKVMALVNPMLEMIRAALEAARTNLSYESVIRLCRTNLSGLSFEEVDLLDNYLLAKGIRGLSGWQQEWIRPGAFIDEEELCRINHIREQLIGKLAPPLLILQRKTGRVEEYVSAVRSLIDSFSLREQMKERADLLRAGGDEAALQKAMEYDQISGILDQVLDEAAALLEGEVVTAREFARILDAGFEEARVGVVPPGLDQVYIGDLERTRLSNIRALLFVGMNDGYVPGASLTGSLLSQADRSFLLRAGCNLAPDARTDCYIQRFYQYLCLTKPSEMLLISWSRNGSDGSEMKPSYLTGALKRLFPDLATERPFEETRTQILSPEGALERLAVTLREEKQGNSISGPDLKAYLREEGREKAQAEALKEAAGYRLSHPALDGKISNALYGRDLTASVSRMESFAGCPYQYFARYGLKLQEREEHRIEAADIGSLLHDALAVFSEDLKKHPQYSWKTVPEEVWKELLRGAILKADERTGNTLFQDSGRNAGTFTRLERILTRTVWALLEQIRAGSFEPVFFEHSFRRPLPGQQLSVTGKIDRIDLAGEDGKQYVKIVDYKSGEKKLSFSELYDGRDIQLAIYQQEALEQIGRMHPGADVHPAGMFYTCLKDPIVDGLPDDAVSETDEEFDGADDRQIRRSQLQKLKPEGLINKNAEVLQLYARDPDNLAFVAPVSCTNGGKIRSSTSLLEEEELKKISAYATNLLIRQSREIREGRIDACPYRSRGSLFCSWCSYDSVCGYDRKLPGARIRSGTALTRQQILEQIAREEIPGE